MKKHKHIQDELEELSTFLSQLEKKKEGYKVPKDYFESLPDVIEKMVIEDKQETTSAQRNVIINWWTKVETYISVWFSFRMTVGFVSLILICGLGFFLHENNDIEAVEYIATLDTVPSEQDVYNYVLENIDDFDEEDLSEMTKLDSYEIMKHIDSESIEEYIDEDFLNSIDEQILKELL